MSNKVLFPHGLGKGIDIVPSARVGTFHSHLGDAALNPLQLCPVKGLLSLGITGLASPFARAGGVPKGPGLGENCSDLLFYVVGSLRQAVHMPYGTPGVQGLLGDWPFAGGVHVAGGDLGYHRVDSASSEVYDPLRAQGVQPDGRIDWRVKRNRGSAVDDHLHLSLQPAIGLRVQSHVIQGQVAGNGMDLFLEKLQ